MKKYMLAMLAIALAATSLQAKKKPEGPQLQFDESTARRGTLTMPRGQVVKFTAYERLYYVTHVEDTTYQYLNVYVPEGATQKTPIFMRTYVGGYMAAPASRPQAGDATGRALQEGYVVVITGSRGRDSQQRIAVATEGATIQGLDSTDYYTGRAPKGLLDLKAAVRYLRYFDKKMLGSAEKIIIDGTSAGGAMAALVGATGNNPAYEPLLEAMGAAKTRDDVMAAVCFCPIIDLEHADMAYEWLYNGVRGLEHSTGSEERRALSNELAALYPAYLNSLGLTIPGTGERLTADNMLDYIKQLLIEGAQRAKDAGAEMPDSIGFVFSGSARMAPPINGQPAPVTRENRLQSAVSIFNRSRRTPGGLTGMGHMKPQLGEYILDLNMPKYLAYVAKMQPLKSVPAFDALGVVGAEATGENEVFGTETGISLNFTAFSAAHNGTQVLPEVQERVRMMNPMTFLGQKKTDVAKYWYIRHGARDRDTAFPVPVVFATKLQNLGKDVDFLLAWNRPHSGDYSLDELFAWMKGILN